MAGFVKNKEKTELLAGLITMGVAILLLGAVILFMTQCSAPPPETTGSTAGSTAGSSTGDNAPPLAENPYGVGDFAYQNGYLTCLAGESMLGVDVSSHQGIIQWDKVAASDVSFAMIRIGYRGYEVGNICEDTMWETNLQGARSNGLPVGIYFFSQAVNVEEALEEANFVLDLLGDMALEMPIVFDWEPVSDTARTANMDAETLNACALAFCEAVASAGYTPMVYFNIDLSSRLLDLRQMQQAGYHFWLALYSDRMTFPHRIHMWQYSDGGSVPGITGNVDLNLYFPYE